MSLSKLRQYIVSLGATASLIMILSGCGTTNTTNSAGTSNGPAVGVQGNYVRQGNTLISGASNLAGPNNLDKWEKQAQANTTSASAQITAAESAHVNGKNQLALQYYQKALAITPNDGLVLTAIGNIYSQSLNQPQKALGWYEKSTTKDPAYGWGWYQLAHLQSTMGRASQAKQTAASGLKQIKSNDPAYTVLQQLSQ